MLAERLGERCGRLVPDSGGNSIDGIVAVFEHEGGCSISIVGQYISGRFDMAAKKDRSRR